MDARARLAAIVDEGSFREIGKIAGNASYDENGDVIPQIYHGKTRGERHRELIQYGIDGGVRQVKDAHDIAGGNGRIHINVLWEMGGAEPVLDASCGRPPSDGAWHRWPDPCLHPHSGLRALHRAGVVRRPRTRRQGQDFQSNDRDTPRPRFGRADLEADRRRGDEPAQPAQRSARE